MSNEKKLRLIQVAKEFKVGLNTITDFLQKKGIKSDGSPNTLVEPEVYAVLEKEFGGNRSAGNERESVRERIAQKQATITLEQTQKQAREEEQEVIIKSHVISVKDEIPHPKILGKIDLDAKKHAPKPEVKSTPAAVAEPAPQPKEEKPLHTAETEARPHPVLDAARSRQSIRQLSRSRSIRRKRLPRRTTSSVPKFRRSRVRRYWARWTYRDLRPATVRSANA